MLRSVELHIFVNLSLSRYQAKANQVELTHLCTVVGLSKLEEALLKNRFSSYDYRVPFLLAKFGQERQTSVRKNALQIFTKKQH